MEGVAVDLISETTKFLVARLIQQIKEQRGLIGNAPEHVQQLENDLNILQNYLQESIKIPKSEGIIDLLAQVRDSIYDAEDAMDSFLETAVRLKSNIFSRAIPNSKLVRSAEHVKSACETVQSVRQQLRNEIDNINNTTTEDRGLENQVPPSNREYAPIFVDEEEILRECLTRDGAETGIIVITGTNGVGKSTLAAKLFHDSKIPQFPLTKRIWVGVSNPTATNIFLTILKELNKLSDEDMSKNDDQLSQLVAICLEREALWIVVDNISETENWKKLQSAFGSSKSRSKVLIISNNEQTARLLVGSQYDCIKLNQLDRNESWTLLEWLRFKDPGCPPELEGDGKLIAAQCGGLPLNIVFAADVLAKKDSPSYIMRRRQRIWQDVCRDLSAYYSDPTIPRSTRSLLSCYNELPHHLRPCFLYLGIFPQRSKFSASKLIGMWIAEGFIPPSNVRSLEKTAETYLMELIDRNIITVEDQRSDDTAKTCSVSELIHDFCKTEAGKKVENFFQEYRKNMEESVFNPPITEVEKNRRVCIHDHISSFIPKLVSSRPYHSRRIRLRSFVSHAENVLTMDRRGVSVIRVFFKLLRVLDAKPIEFNKIPSDLCQLVHLRYVTLSLNGGVLPASISNLRKMRTLIVHTASPILKIKADVLRMMELRHLKTNASATLPKKSKASDESSVRTICGISPKSLTQHFVDKAPNLKKLGIRGQLALLLHDDNNELLSRLDKVEKLKLLNDKAAALSNFNGRLSDLLEPNRFPTSMTSLTLSATQLDWSHVSILRSLERLEKLKLKDDAFVGETWNVSESFPHLQSLHIDGLNFVNWTFSRDHFPRLRRLELSECEKLIQVSIELAHSATFQELYMHNCSKTAVASARRIHDERSDLMKQAGRGNNMPFRVSITPDDDPY